MDGPDRNISQKDGEVITEYGCREREEADLVGSISSIAETREQEEDAKALRWIRWMRRYSVVVEMVGGIESIGKARTKSS